MGEKVFACNWHPVPRYEEGEYQAHMDAHHPGWRDLPASTDPCAVCGTRFLSTPLSVPLPPDQRCMHCPPVECGTCGEPDDRSCSCWVSIEDMPLADVKALFAADGTFDLDPVPGGGV